MRGEADVLGGGGGGGGDSGALVVARWCWMCCFRLNLYFV